MRTYGTVVTAVNSLALFIIILLFYTKSSTQTLVEDKVI